MCLQKLQAPMTMHHMKKVALLLQFLHNKSLSSIRDTWNNENCVLEILRNNYIKNNKPRISAVYHTAYTSLKMIIGELILTEFRMLTPYLKQQKEVQEKLQLM